MDTTTPTELFSVEGLVAVITGGGTGLGLMMAAALENNSAIVYIVGRRMETLDQAVKTHSKRGNMHAIQGDVSSTESIQAVAATIEKNHGYINLLVNNAGIALNTNPQPLRTTPAENEPTPEGATPHPGIRELQAQLLGAGTRADWATTFDVNVTGSHYATLAFMALLEAGNRSPWGLRGVTSQVIFVASVAAFRRDSTQFTFSYALSKSAVVHMAKSFTNLLSGWKIRSNVLAPGVYPSEMTTDMFERGSVNKMAPLGRPGDKDDMAGLILFLASRAGAYMDGSVQLTDGGRLSTFSSTF